MGKVLSIRNWGKHYEINRTKDIKKTNWVPLPNNLNNDGYIEIMSQSNGLEILGVWTILLEVASTCDPRGVLWRRKGIAHDADSLSRLARAPKDKVNAAIGFLLKLGWIESLDMNEENPAGRCGMTAATPQEGAGKPQLQVGMVGRTEQNRQVGSKAAGLPVDKSKNAKIMLLLGMGINSAVKSADAPRWQSVLKHLAQWPLEEIATEIQAIKRREGEAKPPLYYLEGARRRLQEKQHEALKKAPVPDMVRMLTGQNNTRNN